LGQRAVIYARVSTSDQSCERQIADLTAFAERGGYEIIDVFKETASGTSVSRTARNQIMEFAQARQINAVLVTELSRWGRSTQDLLETLNRLAGWKVSVVAMSGMTFEFETPHGRMMATMLAGIAQFERDLISDTGPNQTSSHPRSSPPVRKVAAIAGSRAISASAKTPS